MVFVFTQFGYATRAEIKNESKYNRDRFNPDFIVGKQDDISFEIDLTDGPVIMEIFNFPSLMTSVSVNISGGEMRVYFDYDLSTLKPEYDIFSDRTVRNLLRLPSVDSSSFISKPSDFTVDLPTYIDLKNIPQTNMIENLDDRIDSLDDQLTGVADLTSKGNELINQTFKIESSYEYSPGNFQADYGN